MKKWHLIEEFPNGHFGLTSASIQPYLEEYEKRMGFPIRLTIRPDLGFNYIQIHGCYEAATDLEK